MGVIDHTKDACLRMHACLAVLAAVGALCAARSLVVVWSVWWDVFAGGLLKRPFETSAGCFACHKVRREGRDQQPESWGEGVGDWEGGCQCIRRGR